MDRKLVHSVEELDHELGRFSAKYYLFRGQARHYVNADGRPNFHASFHRHGCTPLTTLKWTHYAKAMIEYLSRGTVTADTDASGALLQHYGWRSFSLDATTNAAVGAWFSSHTYAERTVLTSIPDRLGTQVHALQRAVRYDKSSESAGYLYVISRAELATRGLSVVDLSERFASLTARTRMSVQHAVVVGPLRSALPPEVVVTELQAPPAVLSAYAASHGLTSQEQLFPSRFEDPILRGFLSLPWERVTATGYERSMSLPEYEVPPPSPRAEEAYLDGEFWIGRHPKPSPLAGAVFLHVPELLLYASGPADGVDWTRLFDLVAACETVVVESSAVWMDPRGADGGCYGKGVVLTALGRELIEVRELVVEHPGTDVDTVAVNVGYTYRLHLGQPIRVPSDADCRCGQEVRHRHHITMLSHLVGMISRSQLVRTGPLEFTLAPQ